jgi:hypothetical protein
MGFSIALNDRFKETLAGAIDQALRIHLDDDGGSGSRRLPASGSVRPVSALNTFGSEK